MKTPIVTFVMLLFLISNVVFGSMIYDSGDTIPKDISWIVDRPVIYPKSATDMEEELMFTGKYSEVRCNLYDQRGMNYGIRCYGEYRKNKNNICSVLSTKIEQEDAPEAIRALSEVFQIFNCD